MGFLHEPREHPAAVPVPAPVRLRRRRDPGRQARRRRSRAVRERACAAVRRQPHHVQESPADTEPRRGRRADRRERVVRRGTTAGARNVVVTGRGCPGAACRPFVHRVRAAGLLPGVRDRPSGRSRVAGGRARAEPHRPPNAWTPARGGAGHRLPDGLGAPRRADHVHRQRRVSQPESSPPRRSTASPSCSPTGASTASRHAP